MFTAVDRLEPPDLPLRTRHTGRARAARVYTTTAMASFMTTGMARSSGSSHSLPPRRGSYRTRGTVSLNRIGGMPFNQLATAVRRFQSTTVQVTSNLLPSFHPLFETSPPRQPAGIGNTSQVGTGILSSFRRAVNELSKRLLTPTSAVIRCSWKHSRQWASVMGH